MKRKVAVVAVLCALMMALSIGTAQAVLYTCTIQGTGMTNSGYYYVTLTDTAASPAFTARNFLVASPSINAPVANQMYATALTASAGSRSLVVDLPGTYEWATILQIVTQ